MQDREQGAALVEFALVLSVFVLILFGIVEFSRAFQAQAQLTHASREGVRVQAVTGDPERAVAAARAAAPGEPAAEAAIDMALRDLAGKRLGAPLRELLGLAAGPMPPTSFTIGIETPEIAIERVREAGAYEVLKVKLGSKDDRAMLEAIRSVTDQRIRVDANEGWTLNGALERLEWLEKMGVEFVEQPLPAEAWDAMRRVYRESALPLVADESCRAEGDVDRCRGRFHGVNVKLQKCGGLTPARRMIERARQLGLKAMVGCMTESTVGISAIAQLLPLLDYVDLDGALLLDEDIASGVSVDRGQVEFPHEAGCGVKLLRS